MSAKTLSQFIPRNVPAHTCSALGRDRPELDTNRMLRRIKVRQRMPVSARPSKLRTSTPQRTTRQAKPQIRRELARRAVRESYDRPFRAPPDASAIGSRTLCGNGPARALFDEERVFARDDLFFPGFHLGLTGGRERLHDAVRQALRLRSRE